ncbi:unnamed protein product [Cylindrotheca closterium]|uniref:HSF-type DNA-binding domain-containing protein n=1 Tax=Cylindrotheca closterium TaxID=2856 RepID=A0AAD2PUG7_9STRA|nr:unnamed protein product [Cylindrotheca closterium]
MNKQLTGTSEAETEELNPPDGLGRQKAVTSTKDPSSKQTSELNFPAKLFVILSTPGYSDIICWLPHGRSWRVLQPQQFEEKVLPHFFRHGRYASFTRQVNGWGFRRIVSGPDYNSYYHKDFLRGKPELYKKMRRPTKEEREIDETDSLPDFYSMEPLTRDLQAAKQVRAVTYASPPAQSTSSFSRSPIDRRNLSFLTPMEQHVQLQRELVMLEQRRQAILSQLQALPSIPVIPAQRMLILSQQIIRPTNAQSPIGTGFQSQLNSLRIQQSLLQQQQQQHLPVAWPHNLLGHRVSMDQSQGSSSRKTSNEE